MAELDRDIGQFLVLSFPESIPRDRTLHFLLDNGIGGIILFADHCRKPDSLRSWLGDLKEEAGPGLFVAVDQEGGRVCRLRGDFPKLDAPREYGKKNDTALYAADLAAVCSELVRIGINWNLVPVVDLFDVQPGHVLSTRAFSDDIETVEAFSRQTIVVHRQFGLLTCAKHFPGLGRTAGDPHLVMAISDLTEGQFREQELKSFQQAIRAGVDSIMVTHLLVEKVDSNPAVTSEVIIGEWLKGELEFDGPVVTDDLLMSGLHDFMPRKESAVRAFAAGCDIMLFGQDLERAKEALFAFADFYSSGKLPENRKRDAISRVNKLRKELDAPL